ncbi:MAG: cupin domain-containing protein [Lachnospiraceae bacterium]|nr:cupin domain-containing protein [Lachnospiraceae bacterium]
MVLLITGGIGYYQQEGEPAQILRKGDVVDIEPGVINNWHIHEGGQILIATDGVGYHQIEGEEVQALYPGDVAFCPPGVPHWHGGSADTSFAHIAVNTNPELTGLEWLGRISEEEYEALPAGEKAAP